MTGDREDDDDRLGADPTFDDERPPLAPGESEAGSRPHMPEMPPKPALPAQTKQKSGGGIVSLLVMFFGLFLILAILFVCSGGNPLAPLIAIGIFAFAALHYVLWGWWLSKSIRRDVEREQRGDS